MKHCPNCQMPLADGIVFCSRCGTKLSSAATSVISPEPAPQPVHHPENAPHKAPKSQSHRGLVGVVWAGLVVNLLLGGLLLSMILGVFGPLAQQRELREKVDLLQSQVRVLEEVYRGLDVPGGNFDGPMDPLPTIPNHPDSSGPSQTRPTPTTLPTQLEEKPEDATTESEIPDEPTESATVPTPPPTVPTEAGTVPPTDSQSYDGYYVVNTKEYPLNIRSSRSTEGKILGTIPIGTRIHVTAATGTGQDDWGYVEYDGICGYIAMQYLLRDFE